MKKLSALLVLVVGTWFNFHDSAGSWTGMPAARDPLQTETALPTAFTHDAYTIKPLATYDVTAVVLSRSRYRNDRDATLCPIDLALGWGPMSVSGVINELKISQSGRWYEYAWSGPPPIDPVSIGRHSANTHCMPATPEIREKLLSVKRHELVTLKGYLVEVSGPNGYRWRSSLTREDTRGGACEVMWITDVTHQKL